jgi:hypothetical protein
MASKSYLFSPKFMCLLEQYVDSPKYHQHIWEEFYTKTNKISYLKKHRNYIEKNKYGYGDRSFHYMWKLLIDQMPDTFSFLEIGVYKGQIISLVQLLSDKLHKKPVIIGVTPLSNRGDHYWTHPEESDYLNCIRKLYDDFHLTFRNTKIMKGLSQEKSTQKRVLQYAPYNVVFVDGCHDYEVVKSDLIFYSKLVKPGGFLVLDDAGNFLHLPKYTHIPKTDTFQWLFGNHRISLFHGFIDVSNAARDTIEKNRNYLHIFSCGHDRVWMRIR